MGPLAFVPPKLGMPYVCPGGTPSPPPPPKPWALFCFATLWGMIGGGDAPLVRKSLLVFEDGVSSGLPVHSAVATHASMVG